MIDVLVAIVLVVIIVGIIWYLAKQVTALLINAVLGLICLFLINTLGVMQWIGRPDLGYNLVTLLICAIGGLPGVLIVILLNILGITL
jgi:hypothetical protein